MNTQLLGVEGDIYLILSLFVWRNAGCHVRAASLCRGCPAIRALVPGCGWLLGLAATHSTTAVSLTPNYRGNSMDLLGSILNFGPHKN